MYNKNPVGNCSHDLRRCRLRGHRSLAFHHHISRLGCGIGSRCAIFATQALNKLNGVTVQCLGSSVPQNLIAVIKQTVQVAFGGGLQRGAGSVAKQIWVFLAFGIFDVLQDLANNANERCAWKNLAYGRVRTKLGYFAIVLESTKLALAFAPVDLRWCFGRRRCHAVC